MTRGRDQLTVARAEALFASGLSAWAGLTRSEVYAAIRDAVRTYGGVRGCAGEVAAAYGEYPETAVSRMRWARQLVQENYSSHPTGKRRRALWLDSARGVACSVS
jgi:hypothetical protein